MILERFSPGQGKEKYEMPLEQDLAGLMIAHYQRIEEILTDKEKGLSECKWVLDHVEVESGGEKCLVVAGLFPSIDEEGKAIPGIRATPSVICIPKGLMNDEDWKLFGSKDHEANQSERKENVVRDIVRKPEVTKLYNAHGWDGNPYVMGMPMVDMAVEYGGVAVLMGVMGSMKTTNIDMIPREFRDSNVYGWDEIKHQILGFMYQVEGEASFKNHDNSEALRRVLIGHSMQGRTVLRLLVEELHKLPNTYFVPITPVMKGAQKEQGRHVILGHDWPGLVMKAEMAITSRIMKEETREKILCWALPLIKEVIKHYLHEGSPYGENLLLLAHLLEYINNPWAVINATKLLDNAGETIGAKTRLQLANLTDSFMLVCAVEDKVLSSEQLKAMIVDLASPMRLEGGELVIDTGKKQVKVRACYFRANHYLGRGHWGQLTKTELAFELKKNGVNLPAKSLS